MNLPQPSIARRVLPLLDIIFILLAFFIIIPQGVMEKKKVNIKEEEAQSELKELNPSRFLYLVNRRGHLEVKYTLVKNGKMEKKNILFFPRDFAEVDGEVKIPSRLISIIEKIRGQSKKLALKKSVMLVIQYEIIGGIQGRHIFIAPLVSFAQKNQIPYAVARASSR